MAWFGFILFMTILGLISMYVNPDILKKGNDWLLYPTMLWVFCCFLSFLGFLYFIVWVLFVMFQVDDSTCSAFVVIGFLVVIVPMIYALKAKFK